MHFKMFSSPIFHLQRKLSEESEKATAAAAAAASPLDTSLIKKKKKKKKREEEGAAAAADGQTEQEVRSLKCVHQYIHTILIITYQEKSTLENCAKIKTVTIVKIKVFIYQF